METLKDYKIREAQEAAAMAQRNLVDAINEMAQDIRDALDPPTYKSKSFMSIGGVYGATGIIFIGKRSVDLFPRFMIQGKDGCVIDPNDASLLMLGQLSLALAKAQVRI